MADVSPEPTIPTPAAEGAVSAPPVASEAQDPVAAATPGPAADGLPELKIGYGVPDANTQPATDGTEPTPATTEPEVKADENSTGADISPQPKLAGTVLGSTDAEPTAPAAEQQLDQEPGGEAEGGDQAAGGLSGDSGAADSGSTTGEAGDSVAASGATGESTANPVGAPSSDGVTAAVTEAASAEGEASTVQQDGVVSEDPATEDAAPVVPDVTATPGPANTPEPTIPVSDQAAQMQEAMGGPGALGSDVAKPEPTAGTPVVGAGTTTQAQQPAAWQAALHKIGLGKFVGGGSDNSSAGAGVIEEKKAA